MAELQDMLEQLTRHLPSMQNEQQQARNEMLDSQRALLAAVRELSTTLHGDLQSLVASVVRLETTLRGKEHATW